MNPLSTFLFIAVGVSVLAAFIDLRTGHIPNWLTLGTLGSAFALHVAHGASSRALPGAAFAAVTSLAGAALCSVVPLLLHRFASMGGGDLKLLAAIGALLGPVVGLQAETYAFIAVLLYAPIQLCYRGRLWRTLGTTLSLMANPFRPKSKRKPMTPELMTSLRFGPAVAMGVIATTLARWSVG